ncbi:MAG TPA: CapA family protein [Clostridia bacterium]|nr:CapA family protein [Clostridia bacterium]HQO55574.1 CapA family protein [Clostridia bacterium]
MKRTSLLLLAVALLCALSTGMALADEEISIYDLDPSLLATPEPPPANTYSAEPTLQPPATVQPERQFKDGSFQLVITAGGDMTIGGDVRKRGDSLFERELKKQGGDLNFLTRNVRDILLADDLTIVNFEGTLTTAPVYKTNNQFVFSAPPEYVSILRDGGIEAVALQNNHVMDHGETGLKDTKAALESAGIVWSDAQNKGVYEINGVSIAMLTYQQYREQVAELLIKVPQDVQNAKALHDIVIVSFHWGAELDYKPNSNQIELGRATIDAGADLVLGHHSHRINPIEFYKGRYIVYSLGNFSFAGNNKPSDMSTFLFQIRFNVKQNSIEPDSFRIIPCRISSRKDYNDFAPTPFTDQYLINNVVDMLLKNSKGLEYAVDRYPVDWE